MPVARQLRNKWQLRDRRQFWPLWPFLSIFGDFCHFCRFLVILAIFCHFWPFLPVLAIFGNFIHFVQNNQKFGGSKFFQKKSHLKKNRKNSQKSEIILGCQNSWPKLIIIIFERVIAVSNLVHFWSQTTNIFEGSWHAEKQPSWIKKFPFNFFEIFFVLNLS